MWVYGKKKETLKRTGENQGSWLKRPLHTRSLSLPSAAHGVTGGFHRLCSLAPTHRNHLNNWSTYTILTFLFPSSFVFCESACWSHRDVISTPDDFSVKMMGNSATSRWVYLTVGLIVMAELVTVSGRGHIDYPSSFGPKERRKRQGRMSFFFTSASLLKS